MNKLISIMVVLLFSMLSISAQQSNHHDIYIFAADANNASFITQKSILTDAAGLKERDIQVYEIIGC